MTEALSRGNPLLGGLDPDGLSQAVDKSDSSDSTSATSSFDTSGLRDVLGRHKEQVTALQDRLTRADAQSDALRPPTMVQAPPPPEIKDTPPEERWGSVAMMLAGFGGLLTRQPLTASLNAMAAVNHAYNEGDAAKAKAAFDQWHVATQNAQAMNEFTIKAYDGAIKKIGTDRTGAMAEIRATAAALKDDVVIGLFDAGQPDRALALLGARVTGSQQFSDRVDKLQDQRAGISYWDDQNPDADPKVRALAHAAIRAGKDPDDNSKQFTKSPQELEISGEDGKKTRVLADRDVKTGGWVTADEKRTPIELQAGGYRVIPKGGDKVESAASKQRDDVETRAAAEVAELKARGEEVTPAKEAQIRADITAQDSAHRSDLVAQAKQRAAPKKISLNPEAADMEAKQFLLTGNMPALGFGSDARVQILNRAAELAADAGHTIEDYLAGRATWKADTSSLGQITKIADAVQGFENTALENMKVAEGLLSKGAGTAAGPVINRWLQGGKTATGDPDVAAFNTAMGTVAGEYGKIISGGSASIASTPEGAREEAKEWLDKMQSPEAIKAQFAVARQDMTNRKNSLFQQRDLIQKRISHPDISASAPAAQEVSDKAAYDALPPGAHFRKPGDPLGSYRTKQ